MGISEFDIVQQFSQILDLPNQTDGSLFIYNSTSEGQMSTKPDGYYYFEGITFILDAKKRNGRFTGQLDDYMKLKKNPNFIGFQYNGNDFKCYICGEFKPDELTPKSKEYYKDKYFKQISKVNNESIVDKASRDLADLFFQSKVDKQMNVPFIGAVILCLKFGQEINLESTKTIIQSLKFGIQNIIKDQPIERKQKKEFIKRALEDGTLLRCDSGKMFTIISRISQIYNYINISLSDLKGHDIMNNFLKSFRKWNSANAKEKGEVFTPDHIAQLMYDLAYCSKDSVILDPTCGSGTFLTNAMYRMFDEAESDEERKDISQNSLYGIEVSPFNSALAGINMMLHGDGASHIYFEDCFKQLPKFKNCYNRVLMNPPFSQDVKELKFMELAVDNIEDNGIVSCILPKSCLKGTDDKNTDILKKFEKICDILSVVSLPRDLFQPNAGVDTCILTVKKTNKFNSVKTYLINLTDDGFVYKNEQRVDINDSWKNIQVRIINAINNNFDEFTCILKDFSPTRENLFEAYSSFRDYEVDKTVFMRYLRELIASKVLCGETLDIQSLELGSDNSHNNRCGKFKISSILEKLEKGKTKSIDRKVEDKYPLGGVPLVIAKKDNNGIGGKTEKYEKLYSDSICIISGGDGGGGKTYYIEKNFAATGFVLVCKIKEKYQNITDKYSKFYLSVVISERLFKTIGHGRTISEIPEIEIKLPITESGEIDFDYMSNYIKTLQYSEFL